MTTTDPKRATGLSIEETAARYAATMHGDPKAEDLYQEMKNSDILRERVAADDISENKPIRTFDTGATRGADDDKLDYEGSINPIVLRRFVQYMQKHRVQANGKLRTSDNWQKGIPLAEYMKSKCRHDMDMWIAHRSGLVDEDAACAVLFNTMGYLLEILKPRQDNTVGVVNGT